MLPFSSIMKKLVELYSLPIDILRASYKPTEKFTNDASSDNYITKVHLSFYPFKVTTYLLNFTL